MKATDLLRGGETGGSRVNPPTEKQLSMIKIIEEHHPKQPKFLACTSADAYNFVFKYYPLAIVTMNEKMAEFNSKGNENRTSDKITKVGVQEELDL